MRDYSKVSPKFWIGETGRALRKQGVETLVVGMYLMTSPHSNMLGLFYQPLMLIAHETGLPLEGATKGLQGAIEAGFCAYDDESQMVWVYEMAAFQIAEQLAPKDNQCKGIQSEYNKLPMNPFLPAFYERYQHAFHLTAKRGERRAELRDPKPLTSPLQDPPKPGTGTGTGDIKPKPSSSSDDDGGEEPPEADQEKIEPFDQFWDAYPWKAGKQDAHKAWIKVEKNWRKLNKQNPEADMLATLLAAVDAQKEGEQWRRDNGQYIPRAATWLNGGRWLDEVRPYVAPAPKLPAGWWETKEGMEAAGKTLNPPLTPRPGEYPKDFAQRIRTALGMADPDPLSGYTSPPPPEKIERPYVPPAPPEGVVLTEEQREARREEMREQLGKLKQKGNLALAGVAAANAGPDAA